MTRPRAVNRPRWSVAVIGVPIGLVLVGLGIGLNNSTASEALFLLGSGLIGICIVVAAAPVVRNPNDRPSEHTHSTFGDIGRMVERVPLPESPKRPPEEPTAHE